MVSSDLSFIDNPSGYDSRYCGSFFKRDDKSAVQEYLRIERDLNSAAVQDAVAAESGGISKQSLSVDELVYDELVGFIALKILNELASCVNSAQRIIALEKYFEVNKTISVGDRFKILSNIFSRKSYSTQEKLAFYNQINSNHHIDNVKKLAVLNRLFTHSEICDSRLKRHIKNKITLLEIVEKSGFVMDFSLIEKKLEKDAAYKEKSKKRDFAYVAEKIDAELTLKLNTLADLAQQSDSDNGAGAKAGAINNNDNNYTANRRSLVQQLSGEIKSSVDTLIAILKKQETASPADVKMAKALSAPKVRHKPVIEKEQKAEKEKETEKEKKAEPYASVPLKYNVEHNLDDDLAPKQNAVVTAKSLERVKTLISSNADATEKLQGINSVIDEIQQSAQTITQAVVNSKEYFKFGAGVKRFTKDFSVILPSGYTAQPVRCGGVRMYQADANGMTTEELMFNSPLVIQADKYDSGENFSYHEFFKKNLEYCAANKILYKQTVVGGCPAVIKHKKNSDVFNAAVFNLNEGQCYDFKFKFNAAANNKSSVVQRILAGIKFGGGR